MTDLLQLKNSFKDKDLLKQAFTHRSWVNEHPEERGTNERLEFLGDAILEFIVSKEIYEIFPEKEEGYLTSLRANLVNTQNLANLALKLKIGSEIYLSKGEEEGGGRENPSLLADTIEAIIGALFLDQGLDSAYKFVKENLVVDIPEITKEPLKDAKSRLQEHVQSQGLPAPRYKVVEESGPDHNKSFIIEVMIDNKPAARGSGKNKNLAEQEAAKKALALVSRL